MFIIDGAVIIGTTNSSEMLIISTLDFSTPALSTGEVDKKIAGSIGAVDGGTRFAKYMVTELAETLGRKWSSAKLHTWGRK